VASLWAGVYLQRAVVSAPEGHLLGNVTAYQADLRNRTVYVAAWHVDQTSSGSATLIGLGLLIGELFGEHRFRKVYLDVNDRTLLQFASLPILARTEARCRAEVWDGERYCDRLILSFDERSWESTFGRALVTEHAHAPPQVTAPSSLSWDGFLAHLVGRIDLAPTATPELDLFHDLGFDSLEIVRLLVALDDLGVALDDELGTVRTLGDVYIACCRVIGS